jgi:ribosomal protein S18 acetylase RimI-like enzyme
MTNRSSRPARFTLSASTYDDSALADLYNETRVDYIVPMPMNAARMREYVNAYDVHLGASSIVFDSPGEPVGLGMVGLREERGWITRLGVLPTQRGKHLGQYLMDVMLASCRSQGASQMQLEVIQGNAPAKGLFVRNGFEHVRDLLVIRRPPAAIKPPRAPDNLSISPVAPERLPAMLANRTDEPSWLDENRSLLNLGGMQGLRADLPDGTCCWVAYRPQGFQMSHFVFSDVVDVAVMRALIASIHERHPMLDTKIENVPLLSPIWPVLQSLGYIITFVREEMHLTL